MNIERILNATDHTLLAQTATKEQIIALCDEGMRCKVASVCIPSSYVRTAADYVRDGLAVCTVIGFPNGYSTTASKCFEAAEAVQNGASEVDMVIHLGMVKEARFSDVGEEIRQIKRSCEGRLLKVIVETCLLTEEEKIKLCEIVSASGADYIKTSTGFSTGGATREDVTLFREHVAPDVKIKAAGGIASLQDAEDFIRLGAERLGTSRIIKLVKGQEAQGY